MSYCGNCGHKVRGRPKCCSQCGKLYFLYETLLDIALGVLLMVKASKTALYEVGRSHVPRRLARNRRPHLPNPRFGAGVG
jgi:hypothetical protein